MNEYFLEINYLALEHFSKRILLNDANGSIEIFLALAILNAEFSGILRGLRGQDVFQALCCLS